MITFSPQSTRAMMNGAAGNMERAEDEELHINRPSNDHAYAYLCQTSF
jgi:hypothetical protein